MAVLAHPERRANDAQCALRPRGPLVAAAMICPHTTCKHGGQRDRHHRYWPRHWYRTPLEREFRSHPDNIDRKICRCAHDLEHLKKPPKKPSIEEMKRFLGRK